MVPPISRSGRRSPSYSRHSLRTGTAGLTSGISRRVGNDARKVLEADRGLCEICRIGALFPACEA
jgi:hypothetical protein